MRARIGWPMLVTVLAATGQTAAQTPNAGGVPDRNATTYNGREHEPTPDMVPQGSPAQQRRQDDEVERLAKELEQRVRQETATPVPQSDR